MKITYFICFVVVIEEKERGIKMKSMAPILLLLVLAILFVTAHFLYNKLEKRNIIPIKYHPYTNAKTKEFYWEFVRAYFILVCVVVFLVAGYFSISAGLFIIGVLNAGSLYIIYKDNKETQNERIEIIYNEKDVEEQSEFLKNLPDAMKNKIVNTKKVVFYNDYLYFSKYNKVLTREKKYKYLFIHSVKKEDKLLILKYGFLGMPFFKKTLYIPSGKEKHIMKILHKIAKNKKYLESTGNYINLFKGKSK